MTTHLFDRRQIQDQQARLTALYEVSARLGTTLDLSKLLDLVVDSLIQLTGAERGYLLLRDVVTGELTTMAARGLDQQQLNDEALELSHTVVDYVATTGRALLTSNAQEDARFARQDSVVDFQLRSVMCAPLRTLGHTLGVIYVDNRLFSGIFNEDDLALLEAFANQAAIAIQNARLFTETDRALARRVEELAIFQQIDKQLNQSLDLNVVLSSALEWAIRLTDAHSGSIGLLQEEDEAATAVLQLVIQKEVGSVQVHQMAANTHPLLAQVLRDGHSLLTYDPNQARSVDGATAVAQLVVPILMEAHVQGVITLESQKKHGLDDEDMAFVERLADRAAVAIENARLYQAVQAANQAKSDFVSMVTHEMRLPLTAVKGYVDLIASGMAGSLNSQQQEFLAVVQRNLSRMGSLLRDLSEINRLESGKVQFDLQTFVLDDVVQEVFSSFRETVTARQQLLKIDIDPGLPAVYADPRRTSQILANLISNAHKYTQPGGLITLYIRYDARMARIAIQDTGIGISSADQTQLFTQFFRSDNRFVRQQSGWGLGLYIVNKMVQAQGGEMSVISQIGQGSTFTFTLPLAIINE